MKAYVVITLLIPESASRLPELLLAEGWTVRRAGNNPVEARKGTIGGISVFEVTASGFSEMGPLRDRVQTLLKESEIRYFSLFVTGSGLGAGWAAGNVMLPAKDPTPVPAEPNPEP
jgi:hypothetical protein